MNHNRINHIDRAMFYQAYRTKFGSIRKNNTVTTIEAILKKSEQEKTPITHLSYMLATCLHEARHATYPFDFSPIVERGGWSYIIKRYWYNSKVRRWLGNGVISDAWTYRGRGLVQLTGKRNYKKFGLADTPEQALHPETAVNILFDGMEKGRFTGKYLAEYLNPFKKDYYNARRIINGTDKAATIAIKAEIFESILTASNTI